MTLLKDNVEGLFSQSWTTNLQQIRVANAHTVGKYMESKWSSQNTQTLQI